MPTPEEITRLKHEWIADGCWDIENTEGFEEHREELLSWRLVYEQQEREKRNQELLAKAEKLGAPGNIDLARHVEGLETRIDRLEQAVRAVANSMPDLPGDQQDRTLLRTL